MRAMVLAAPCAANLQLRDLPDPVAGPGEVLVRLRAASLNYRDLVVLEGGYGRQQKPADLIPLCDGAGEVAALGAGVHGWRVGERVIGCMFPRWLDGASSDEKVAGALGVEADGTACELRVFPAGALVPMPDGLSFEEAACLPCAALTAFTAVRGAAEGAVVLTQGSGGVSLFALQFAAARGARVIATSSSPEKLERLKALGATDLIDYRADPQWGRTVRRLTGEVGCDLVVDIGGGSTIDQALRAVRRSGTIAVIGVVGGAAPPVNLARVAMNAIELKGVTVGSRADFLEMLDAIQAHAIHPVIDSAHPLAQLPQALERLASGRHFGKVCLSI